MKAYVAAMILGLLLFEAGFVTAQSEGESAGLLEEAEQYWAQRQDVTQLQKAIVLYKKIAASDPTNLDLLVMLSRSHYFWADAYLEGDRMKQTEVYQKGMTYAENALVLDPKFQERVNGGELPENAIAVLNEHYVGVLYWGAANLGKWSVNMGLPVMLAKKEQGRKMMTRCLELDETYFYGGPHRWFGSYYAKLPAFAGRDLNKSKAHFEAALQIAPNYFGTRVLKAEYYARNVQDKAAFRSDLEFVLATPADVMPDLVPEQEVEKRKAANMLEMIDEFFLEPATK